MTANWGIYYFCGSFRNRGATRTEASSPFVFDGVVGASETAVRDVDKDPRGVTVHRSQFKRAPSRIFEDPARKPPKPSRSFFVFIAISSASKLDHVL